MVEIRVKQPAPNFRPSFESDSFQKACSTGSLGFHTLPTVQGQVLQVDGSGGAEARDHLEFRMPRSFTLIIPSYKS